jgi:hypothetical protein
MCNLFLQYAKTIPKPNTGSRRSSRVASEVDIEDLGSETEADDINFQRETPFPDININGNSKPFMGKEKHFMQIRQYLGPKILKVVRDNP